MRLGKATGSLVQHSIAKKAGLKEFFERLVKIVSKNFPLFQRKFVSLKKGKNFASGNTS